MHLSLRRLAVLTVACSLALAPAFADSDKGRGKGKGKHARKHHDDVRVVEVIHYHVNHGPPPWAPAHGYRRKHDHGRAVYQAPYGIATGICHRTLVGAAVGGAAGGLIASEVADGKQRAKAIAGGALLGILIGGSIGNAMDQLDERCVGQVLEHAGSEQSVRWRNPDSGAAVQVTPRRTWEEEGRYCREYTTTVRIDGKPQQAWGTACRQPDGSWQRV
jgi:surface antigen